VGAVKNTGFLVFFPKILFCFFDKSCIINSYLVHGRDLPMIGSMAFRSTGSKASRLATSQATFFSPFISRAYSISYDIETKRSDFIRCKSAV
jgi:hypothetical protein